MPTTTTTAEDLGARVRAAVEAAGLTGKAAAEAAGVDPSDLGKVLRGARRPSSRLAAKVLEALERRVPTQPTPADPADYLPAPNPDKVPMVQLVELAKADHDAVKAAKATGGPRPATPNLDALNRRTAAGERPSSRSAGKGPAGPRQSVVFTVDGKPVLRRRRWTLGYAAAECMKGLDGPHTTAALRALLDRLGVPAPESTPGWEVELPNGVKLGAVTEAQARKAS